jgi:hypothetical protein
METQLGSQGIEHNNSIDIRSRVLSFGRLVPMLNRGMVTVGFLIVSVLCLPVG